MSRKDWRKASKSLFRFGLGKQKRAKNELNLYV